MVYLIQVFIYTGLLFLVYLLFLRNKAIHSFNRAYLLTTALLPLVIPFMRLPQTIYTKTPAVSYLGLELPEFTVMAGMRAELTQTMNILIAAYCVITLFALVRVLYRWYLLRRLVRKSEIVRQGDYTLIYNSGFGPGSWMNYIILPEGEANETIIRHELVHIHRRHTLDIVLMSLLQAFFWYNIFLHFIKKELVQVHEFQADADAATDTDSYAMMLIGSVFNTCTLPLTHSFIIHPIKRRIMMLKNKNKTPLYMGAIATLAALFMVFNFAGLQSCKRKSWDADKKTTVTGGQEQVYKHVEKMPQFNGDMMQFMGANIKYPDYAKANKIEGRVNVQFVVTSTGDIIDVRTVGMKQVDTSLQRAAIEAVSKMPNWIPGEKDGRKVSVQFTMPVTFKL